MKFFYFRIFLISFNLIHCCHWILTSNHNTFFNIWTNQSKHSKSMDKIDHEQWKKKHKTKPTNICQNPWKLATNWSWIFKPCACKLVCYHLLGSNKPTKQKQIKRKFILSHLALLDKYFVNFNSTLVTMKSSSKTTDNSYSIYTSLARIKK